MTATWLLLATGAVGGVLLSAVVSAVETGSYTLNRVRLRVRSEQGGADARRLERLLLNHEDLLLMVLIGNTIADYVCTACVTALLLYAAIAAGQAELYATAIVTPALLVLGGIIPKDWFRRDADRLMYPLARPLAWAVRLARLTGLLWLIRLITRAVTRRFRTEAAAEEMSLPRAGILRMLHEGAALGGLTAFQRDVIERVMRLSSVRVGNVMIPRARAALVAADLPREEFLRIVRMAHFSRLPAYAGDPRKVIGVVNVYDVLTDGERRSIAEHVRPAFVLAPQTNVAAGLLRMQRARQTMAIVQDSAGNCLGILTLKDLVEEVVGDLEVW